MNEIRLPEPPDLSQYNDIKSALISRFKHEDAVHKVIFEEFALNNKQHSEFIKKINKNSRHRERASKLFNICLIIAFFILMVSLSAAIIR